MGGVQGARPRAASKIAFLLFAITLAGAALVARSAQQPDPRFVPAVWVAAESAVLKLHADTGAELARIEGLGEVRALAVDARRGVLWVWAEGRLHAYGFDGLRQRSLTLPPAGREGDEEEDEDGEDLGRSGASGDAGEPEDEAETPEHAHLAVLPEDGSVWIAAGRRLVRLAADGTPLARRSLDRKADALALDPARGRLWVALHDHIEARAASDGSPFAQPALDAGAKVRALAADPATGLLWAGAGKRLLAWNADGAVRHDLALGKVRHLAVAAPGKLWVAADKRRLLRVDASGLVEIEREPFPEHGKARALAADPATGGAWVAGEHELARLGAQGEDLGRIELEEDAHAVAAYADTEPPVVRIEAPSEDAWLAESRPGIVLELTDAGIGFDDASLRILLDAAPLAVACTFEPGRAHCVPDAPIADGAHELRAEGRDFAGNDAEPAAVRFHVDTAPPAPPAPGLVAVVVAGGTATVSAPAGAVEPGAKVHVTNLRTGETVTVTAAADGSFEAELAAAPGDRFRVVVEDRAGNRSPRREVAPTVPDPARLAPPPPATGFMPFHEAVAFLYQGPDPVQRGVAPDAIDPRRVAVLRGRVMDREGRPLAGVRVSILGRPELGHTLTRADGLFDLAVNGGGWLTVAYELEGRLPAHRKVRAPWRDYAWLPDVALIEPDPDVTVVTLDGASPLQVARGSRVRDADGERQATVLFPAGTRAELVLPEGGTRPVTRLSVRLTEYTVGPNGPDAMPAELPPGTVYTYAVELSADEATAAGTDRIRFDRPVVLYVENYLGFPVGTPAPAGWYDRRAARWVPEADGRVIAVLDVTGGVAALDTDGDGQPDDGADVGITDEERRALARLYPAGTSLWRVALTHFSAHDINWAGLDPRARPPASPKPDVPEDPCTGPLERNSIVSCAGQTLIESVEVTGTPYRLLYRSDWVPGRTASVTVPMLGAEVPPGLTRVDLIVDVAGRRHTRSFAPAPDLSHTFVWDGVDAYGRRLSGAYRARIEVRYVFGTSYAMWASYGAVNARRFGTPWGTGALRVLASRPAENPLSIVWRTWLMVVGPGGRGAVAGWHLDAVHTLVP
ncbi:MAG TPA: carboxypeptidase regulatory-like domain-containing protein, partial [Chromatiales bacterium]|nr:carboxypeptidase regulatory-like domain-containing protein [Chromatiales bacterium]